MQILYESTASTRSCLAETAISVGGGAAIVIAVAALLVLMYRRNPRSMRAGFDPRTLGITLMLIVVALGLSLSSSRIEFRRLALDGRDLVRQSCDGLQTVEERIPAAEIESRIYRHDTDERFTPADLRHQLVINLTDGRRLRVPLVAGGGVNDFAALAAWAPDPMALYGVSLRSAGEPVPPEIAGLIPGG